MIELKYHLTIFIFLFSSINKFPLFQLKYCDTSYIDTTFSCCSITYVRRYAPVYTTCWMTTDICIM